MKTGITLALLPCGLMLFTGSAQAAGGTKKTMTSAIWKRLNEEGRLVPQRF